jgi:hypothetical protein
MTRSGDRGSQGHGYQWLTGFTKSVGFGERVKGGLCGFIPGLLAAELVYVCEWELGNGGWGYIRKDVRFLFLDNETDGGQGEDNYFCSG